MAAEAMFRMNRQAVTQVQIDRGYAEGRGWQVGQAVVLHWADSEEWTAQNMRRGVIAGLYAHGLVGLVQARYGTQRIAHWVSYTDLWLAEQVRRTRWESRRWGRLWTLLNKGGDGHGDLVE